MSTSIVVENDEGLTERTITDDFYLLVDGTARIENVATHYVKDNTITVVVTIKGIARD